MNGSERKPVHGGYPGETAEQLGSLWFEREPRDPKRIGEMLEWLGVVWADHSDMRLGQLLVNIAGPDPFFVEDDVMLEYIKNYAP